jgi:hypothetical protein
VFFLFAYLAEIIISSSINKDWHCKEDGFLTENLEKNYGTVLHLSAHHPVVVLNMC